MMMMMTTIISRDIVCDKDEAITKEISRTTLGPSILIIKYL